MELKDILESLRKIEGLNHINLLNQEDKDVIINLEEEYNLGVSECIERDHVVVVTHNSNFREPERDIVINKEKQTVFPALDFPEVKAKEVVSSSPGINVHNYLRKRFDMKINGHHATLLIGFNL
ncbi:MAG: hypothetical protein QGF74_00370 [Candidatus Nanoarchaeia archaeon]|jgi:hypothetical protein|nr:hypothetical protein [Candidatus Nanoarchaeia archaeon]|tara:strand:- start:48438 stop:48809 length:372 start_codon:yes stop_codon:yes gene_type:complete